MADRAEVLRPLLAALPERTGEETTGAETGGVTRVTVILTAPRPLASIQASFFDVPQGRRGLLALAVAEARRRGEGQVGYFQPVDPAHARPEQRYALVDGPVRPEDWTAAT